MRAVRSPRAHHTGRSVGSSRAHHPGRGRSPWSPRSPWWAPLLCESVLQTPHSVLQFSDLKMARGERIVSPGALVQPLTFCWVSGLWGCWWRPRKC